MKKVAVVLTGCGYLDGSEIREAVVALLELDRMGCEVVCFAPDVVQKHVIDHVSCSEEAGASRNVLVESARIARGAVRNIDELKAEDFHALVVPGGYGVAKNLSDVAFVGKDANVLPAFGDVVLSFFEAKKPIGAICIAPAVVVLALKGVASVKVTIGSDDDGLIASLGGEHQDCQTNEICVDEVNKVVSCSAYMQDAAFKDVASGITKLVSKICDL